MRQRGVWAQLWAQDLGRQISLQDLPVKDKTTLAHALSSLDLLATRKAFRAYVISGLRKTSSPNA